MQGTLKRLGLEASDDNARAMIQCVHMPAVTLPVIAPSNKR